MDRTNQKASRRSADRRILPVIRRRPRTACRHDQQGVALALILCAVLLFLMIGGVALDWGFGSMARSQGSQTGRLASLAAINKYAISSGSTSLGRVNEALVEARAALAPDESLDLPAVASGTIPNKYQLAPGRYYLKAPDDDPEPCGPGIALPCFKGIDPEADPNAFINAFKVSGYVKHTTLLGNIFPNPYISRFQEVAVIRPREVCFLLDVSRSTVEKTHSSEPKTLSDGTTVAPPSHFAYMIRKDQDPANSFPFSLQYEQNVQQCRWDGTSNSADVSCSSISPGLPEARPGHATDPLLHFRSDYQSISISTANVGDMGSVTRHPPYTDTRVNDQASYMGGEYRIDFTTRPEPLTSLVTAVRAGVQGLRDIAGSTDKVCLIAFDSRDWWPRVFQLSSVSGEETDHLLDLLDWSTDANFRQAMQHGLFPSAGGSTNIVGALSEALRQFNLHGSPNANRSIVLISDGRQNCSPCSPTADRNGDGYIGDGNTTNNDGSSDPDFGPFNSCRALLTDTSGLALPIGQVSGAAAQCAWADLNGDLLVDALDLRILEGCEVDAGSGTRFGVGCSNTYCRYRAGMDEPGGLFDQIDRLQQANIKFNSLILSDLSGPHVADVADPDAPGQCLSESAIREQKLDRAVGFSDPFISNCKVDPRSSYWNKSDTPFWDISVHYWRTALYTGGQFIPLRSSSVPYSGCGPCVGQCCPGVRRCTSNESLEQQATSAVQEALKDFRISLVKVTN